MKARTAFHGAVWAAFLLLLAGLPGLRVNTDFLQLLPRTDPAVRRYLAEGKAQGYRAGYVVAVPLREWRFDADAFAWSGRLAARLRALPHVKNVDWIGNCRGDCGRVLRGIRDFDNLTLQESLDSASGAEDSLRRYHAWLAETAPRISPWLAPGRQRTEVFFLRAAGPQSPDSLADAVLDALYPALDSAALDPVVAGLPKVAGTGVISHAVNRDGAAKGLRIFLIAYLALFILLSTALRSPRAIVLSLASLLAAVLATHGAMGWLGLDLNILTVTVASLVLVLGIEDTIHITRHLAESGSDRLWEVIKPCALVSLTTAAGFAALLFSDLPALRGFGISVTLGVALEFLISWYAYATWGSALRDAARVREAVPREARVSPVGAWLLSRTGLMRKARWPLLLAVLGIGTGISRLKVDNDFAAYYPHRDRSFTDFAWIEKEIYRPERVEVILKPKEGDFFSARNLQAVREAEAKLRAGDPRWRDAVWPLSGYDKRMLNGVARKLAVDSAYRAEAADFRDSIRLSVGIGFRATSRELESWIAGLDSIEYPGLAHRLSGSALLLSRVVNALVRGQAANDIASLILILSVLAFLPRRARLALPAALANLIPIGLVFAAMGWSRVGFDMTTSTVASIAAGIIVDNTIHLFWSLRKAAPGVAGRAELTHSLGDITTTSAVLAGGFLTLACSSLLTFRLFGLLLALAVTASWVCNVVFFAPFIQARLEASPIPPAAAPAGPGGRGANGA